MASDFDPRFDPAFQRGFDQSRVEPLGTKRVEPVETSPTRPRVDRSRVEFVETSPAIPWAAPLPPTLRGNPFIPTLWIVAVLFTAAGVWAQFFAQTLNYSPTAPTAAQEYVLPSVLSALSPWLFTAGLAAGVATLVIHALRWRPAD